MQKFEREHKDDLSDDDYWELTHTDDPCDDVSHWIGRMPKAIVDWDPANGVCSTDSVDPAVWF